MGALFGLGSLWVILVLTYYLGCLALGGWLASEKGYSVGSWVVLLLLFGILALLVLVGAPDKKSQLIMEEQSNLIKNASNRNIHSDSKKCPFCAESIKNEAIICPHCGNNIEKYENEKRIRLEEEKKRKEIEIREKFKNLEDIFADSSIMEEANKIRRIYGKGAFVSHLKKKAKELGLGDIDLNENDIE